ncbi:MAG: peptidoglycan DD-metalloendopeptidase family protein [Patescibacteria group bacterium]
MAILVGAFFANSDHVTYAGLFGGANSQNVGLSSSLTANPNSNYSIGGGDITISGGALLPDSGMSGTVADLSAGAESDQISIYVVRPGDSLSGIANMFNVSVNTIRWANDLSKNSVLQTGQTLLILPVDGIRHTVLKGETVASLAKKYNGDTREIVQFNGLENESDLKVGQIVMIPGGEEPAAAVTPGTKPTAPVKGASGPSYAGYYLRPISGGTRTQGLHGYNGIDLADRAGTEIFAAASGRVIVAKSSGWNGGYGNYVVISHPNGTQTLYSHLRSLTVAQGATVERGQVIGYMGMTGKATGVHVHFEVRGAKNPF